MIDTHVHLDHELYEGVLPEINELDMVIQICTDITIRKISHKNVKYALGIHPVDVSKYDIKDVNQLIRNAKDDGVVAIGEIGLDYHWHPEEKVLQELFFERQLNVALEVKKPVIIHARNAYKDLINILSKNEFNEVFGVVHSFSGTLEEAEKLINLGYSIGFTGPITFKNGSLQRNIVEHIDLKHILVETDSPFLTPAPKRGEINVPTNVFFIAEKIASLKKISLAECISTLDSNAKNMFKLE